MKAFQIKQHEHPSKVSISEIAAPKPRTEKGEVLVDVYAAGLNFFDILQAQGKYQTQPPLPFVLGAEIAGRISASAPLPDDCPYQPGDRVFGYAQGAYAEQVVASHRNLLPIPDNLSFEEASTIPLTTTTSYVALVDRARAKAGEWVLVHAGAGGVGLAACQIAKVLGCKVIATASSLDKRQACIEHGKADNVVDYTQKDWQKEVMKITGGKGVNVVFDPVGMIIPSLKCIAWNARLVVVGFAAGSIEKIPANLLLLKQASVSGVYWGGMAVKDPASVLRVFMAVLGLLQEGKVKQVLYPKQYVGLEKVSEGLGDIESRKTWGKAVVRIRAGDGDGVGRLKDVRAKL
ncbi:alcohol dehydrogenase [Kwoniella heveanensis BCC8398]|uniref:Alcohol dehydrogenase n=1 Tax=Kwoniella heveanensis BCC8398 TaxID=1296120 RepID=A0A1B9H0B1_9TREE|nr:alcohol dehydrogenase [Kwoniella heveanensis BCC8398]